MTEFALGLAALMVWPFAADGLSSSGEAAFWSVMILVALMQLLWWLGKDGPVKQ